MSEVSPQAARDWYNNPANHGTYAVVAFESEGKVIRRTVCANQLRLALRPNLILIDLGQMKMGETCWFEQIGLTSVEAESAVKDMT